MKIVSVGELLIDFTPAGESESENPIYEMNCGGACANVAAAAAMLGADSEFIGKVGDDVFGSFLINKLKNCNVNTDYIVKDSKNATTLAFVHLSADGDRSFSFVRNPGAETRMEPKDILEKAVDEADILHFGSIPLSHEPSRSTIINVAKRAYSMGKIVSFDPNLRRLLWDDLECAKNVMLSCLSFCNILKVSEEELEFLTGCSDVSDGVKAVFEQYKVPIILATLGKRGVYCKCGDEIYTVPGLATLKTVDTTGAGDCFIGAFLTQIPVEGIEKLKGKVLEDALAFSNAAAGFSTTGKGAIPSMPSLEDVKSFCSNT